MTTAEKLQVAAVGVAVLAFVGREYNTIRIERKRAQPIVIAHEKGEPGFSRQGEGWTAEASLTNDGGGNAFNIAFGIELRGVRFPYRLNRDDPRSGNRQRVIRVGEEIGPLELRLESLETWEVASLKSDGKMWETRVYWARYENASGQTWETRNPWARSGKLDIRRVRFAWPRDWRANRRRKSAGKRLREAMDNTRRQSEQALAEREAAEKRDKPD